MYCWRLADGRLEFDGSDPQETRLDYDALKDAVSALLGGEAASLPQALAAQGDGR